METPGISTAVPDLKSVNKFGTHTVIIDRPLRILHQQFLEENPDISLSFSTFAANCPTNVKTTKQTVLISCLCEYCTNIDLKLRPKNLFSLKHMSDIKIKDRYEAINISLCPKLAGEKFHKIGCI